MPPMSASPDSRALQTVGANAFFRTFAEAAAKSVSTHATTKKQSFSSQK